MATVGMVCEMVMSGSSARHTSSKRSMSTATAKPTATPRTRPTTASSMVTTAWPASRPASATSAWTTSTGLGSMKVGTNPSEHTACQAASTPTTVSVGATQRLWSKRSPALATGYFSPSWYLETLRSVDRTSPEGL